MHLTKLIVMAFLGTLPACINHVNVQCGQDADCNLSSGGACTAVTGTGDHWCAYPDSGCPNGYRYSTLDVGDGVSGACVIVGDGNGIDGGVGIPFGTLAIRVGGNEPNGTDVPQRVVASGREIAVIGILNQPADLGGGVRMGAFVAKYNSDGSHLWSRSWSTGGSTGGVAFYDVTADASGDIFVAGALSKTADFGCGAITSTGIHDLLLVRLNSTDGSCKWSIHAGGSEESVATTITPIGSDILVGGGFGSPNSTTAGGTLMVGSTKLTSGGAQDIFLARFQRETGMPLWATSLSGTKNDYIGALTVVDSDSFAIAGYFYGGVLTVGGTAFTSQLFAARFKADGSGSLWAQQYGNTDPGDVRGLALLPSGDLMLGTNFASSIAFGSFVVPATGSRSIALARLDGTTGTPVWAKAAGNTMFTTIEGLTSLPNGNVAGVAQFQTTISFGGDDLIAGAGQALALFELTPDGQHVSSRRYGGGNEQDFVSDVRPAQSGEVVLTGTYESSIDFGASSVLTSAGSQTIFAARVTP